MTAGAAATDTAPRPDAPDLTRLLRLLSDLTDRTRAPQIQDLLERWSAARLRVLLLGEAKRGKSTVGNALLGRRVLPTGTLPLTAVATTVRSGEPERIEVRRLNGSTITAGIGDLARYVTESGNPDNVAGVRDVVAYVAAGFPHANVDLVDTPGIGSVFAHNTAGAEASLRSVDVALLILGVDPPITADERDLLRRVHTFAARTYVVLNKIDRLDADDRPATERFTRKVIAEAVNGDIDIPVFPVSARQAERARADRDENAWQASGMDRVQDVLRTQLARTWRDDLAAGIAGAAHRVAAELLDEANLARRTHDLLAGRQQHRVTAFRQTLDRLPAAGEDAAAAADAILARCQQAMDADAAAVLGPLTVAVRRDLDARLSRSAAASAAELESAGWAAIGELVADAVDGWRKIWAEKISATTRSAGERLQQLLDDAVSGIQAAAADHLGVELTAPAPVLASPHSGAFDFDVAPRIGWTQPVSSAVRRRIPGAAGRDRMSRFLRDEAVRMVDKHIGRARADFQAGITRIRHQMRVAAIQACATRHTQLLEAVRAAEVSTPNPSAGQAGADRRRDLEAVTADLALVRSASLDRAARR